MSLGFPSLFSVLWGKNLRHGHASGFSATPSEGGSDFTKSGACWCHVRTRAGRGGTSHPLQNRTGGGAGCGLRRFSSAPSLLPLQVVNVTGNQDICYYNFLCAHPLGNLRWGSTWEEAPFPVVR